jgi:hypothetical protein
VRTGSILCSYQIKDIDAVFSGPYLSYDNTNREWKTTENQPFSVSLTPLKSLKSLIALGAVAFISYLTHKQAHFVSFLALFLVILDLFILLSSNGF